MASEIRTVSELAEAYEREAWTARAHARAVGHHTGTIGGSTQIMTDSDRVVMHERAATWAEAARMARALAKEVAAREEGK